MEQLGDDAEGLEGLGLGPDPDGGFTDAFRSRFGRNPDDVASSSYDAVALLAYGLQRSGGVGGARLNRALAEVVDARGAPTSWDADGVRAALAAIERGELPDVTGAASALEFDAATHTDLLSSTYEHWRVEGGAFRTVELLPSRPVQPGTSDARVTALESLEANYRSFTGPPYEPPAAKTGLWALLVATSSGMENYRHQADVFAQYQLLREAGVPDERIVVVVQDDVSIGGRVPYRVGGKDVRAGVDVDYRLDEVDAGALLAILAGRRSDALPKVIDSSASDNVYVFIAGHGDTEGVHVGLNQSRRRAPATATRPCGRPTWPPRCRRCPRAGRYRRLLIAVEACKGGVMGAGLDAPGALLVSGASPAEDSLSARFDVDAEVWLADQFAATLEETQRAAVRSDLSLDAALREIYLHVGGSHVSSYGGRFGDTGSVRLSEFVTP